MVKSVWENDPFFTEVCSFYIHLILFQFKGSDSSNGDGGSESASVSVLSSSQQTFEEPHTEKYRLLRTVGKGSSNEVQLGKHLPTGKEVGSTADKFIIFPVKLFGTSAFFVFIFLVFIKLESDDSRSGSSLLQDFYPRKNVLTTPSDTPFFSTKEK